MSKTSFSANSGLWGKSRNLDGSTFQPDELRNEGSVFEVKPISSAGDEVDMAEEDLVEEVELIEDAALDSASFEAESLVPDEPLVSFTQSEYESHLREKSAETELRVREQLEAEFKGELGRLSSRQSDFFEAVIDAVRSDNLTAEIASFALKIGSFLARSQLKIDESVISDFVSATLADLDHRDIQDISVQVSREWQSYLATVNEKQESGVKFTYEDTLGPGDIIVKAGNSGYLDLLQERIDNIEDQLRSTQPPREVENFVELLRRSYIKVDIVDTSDTGAEMSGDRSTDNNEYPDTEISDFNEETVAGPAEAGLGLKTTTGKEEASDE